MTLASVGKFMAVGAHCDDVDLRLGGTFSRLTREGKQGCYVVAIENAFVGAHHTVADSYEALRVRREESTRASQIIGAARLEWLELKSYYFSAAEPKSRIFPSFDSPESLREELKDAIFQGLPPAANASAYPQCRDRFTQLIDDFQPDVIFTHSPDDRHPDHYAMSRFVEFMVAELRESGRELELCFWEPGSGMPIVGFFPNLFVELSEEDVAKKQQAIDCYVSQFPTGLVDTLAADRAAEYGKLLGVKYAEPFRSGICDPTDPWRGRCGIFDVLERSAEEHTVYRLASQ